MQGERIALGEEEGMREGPYMFNRFPTGNVYRKEGIGS